MFWTFFLSVLIFLVCQIAFYPLTLMFRIDSGTPSIYWLPRVFGGYAKPIPLRSGAGRKKINWQQIKRIFRLLKRIIKFAGWPALEQLYFNFFLQRWGASYFAGECIISFTLCDIINKHIRHAWRKLRRKNYVERA